MKYKNEEIWLKTPVITCINCFYKNCGKIYENKKQNEKGKTDFNSCFISAVNHGRESIVAGSWKRRLWCTYICKEEKDRLEI